MYITIYVSISIVVLLQSLKCNQNEVQQQKVHATEFYTSYNTQYHTESPPDTNFLLQHIFTFISHSLTLLL